MRGDATGIGGWPGISRWKLKREDYGEACSEKNCKFKC